MSIHPIISNDLDSIAEICERYGVGNVYAFGSVFTDRFTEDSDVDELVNFKDIPILEKGENCWLLEEALERLLSREIGLLTETSLSNPYFIKVMNRTKTLIYEG